MQECFPRPHIFSVVTKRNSSSNLEIKFYIPLLTSCYYKSPVRRNLTLKNSSCFGIVPENIKFTYSSQRECTVNSAKSSLNSYICFNHSRNIGYFSASKNQLPFAVGLLSGVGQGWLPRGRERRAQFPVPGVCAFLTARALGLRLQHPEIIMVNKNRAEIPPRHWHLSRQDHQGQSTTIPEPLLSSLSSPPGQSQWAGILSCTQVTRDRESLSKIKVTKRSLFRVGAEMVFPRSSLSSNLFPMSSSQTGCHMTSPWPWARPLLDCPHGQKWGRKG